MNKTKIKFFEKIVKQNNILEIGINFLNILNEKFPNNTSLIVGGTPRDILLGNKINDIDIATNIPIDMIDTQFNTHDIGRNKEFFLTVVKWLGENIEVCNFRTENTYTNCRHPDNVQLVTTFEEDTKRRDFSVNSLGLDINGYIIDHNNGLSDLKNGIIRTVGNPQERFNEDYLRMIRCCRFTTRFGFVIHPDTLEAIQNNAEKINNVSKERIFDELFKMAKQTGTKFADSIMLLKATGLLKHILPDVDIMDQFEHSPEHHPEGFLVREI